MRFEHPTLRHGLVGAWCPSLGASGLTLIDRSGRNNHGTLTNMGGQDNWRASGSGLSIPLDGTNDYVDCGAMSRFGLSGAATMSAWVYPTALGANRSRIIDGGVALKIGTNSPFSDVHAFVGGGETRTATGVVAVGNWYHIAATWSIGGLISVFINGTAPSIALQTSGVSSIPTTGSLEFGRLSAFSLFGNHRFDDIRLYNRALTLAEIRLLASRRGIGLTPLPDRAAGLPRRFSVNVGGTWRSADSYVNVGGDWRLSQPSVNVGGVWK